MKKIYFIFAAMVGVALTSCTGDELTDTSPTPVVETESPIMFGSLSKGFTRGDYTGADAAALLGNQFVVSGYKGTYSEWGKSSTTSTMVFDNYVVKYKENTAHTTATNVANWEYVGQERIKHAIDNGITSQATKYWDYSAPQYDFIAWSTGTKTAIYKDATDYPTLGANEVRVSAITPKKATGTGDDKVAYTFEGTAANLSQCYIADLVTVKKSNTNYKDPVTLKFRQLGTKVRIGIYETIPGYSVKDVKFYTQGGILTDINSEIVENATIFSTAADIYTEGTYTITFPTVDGETSDNNQAHVSFAPKTGVTQTTTVNWGKLNYTIAEEGEKTAGAKFLGRSSNTASFAGNADNNYYVVYLPNETGANLNLRVDFTLEAIDGGGEEIKVKNAKAQVPSIYTTWKPGFAYTYLFKISDKTNGRTGVYDPTQSDDAEVNSDPAGLYPITFDAVVVNAEDNDATQETITTVMTPSITTYQQNSTVVNADEYTVNGKDIFVTVNEGDAIVDITGKAAVYIIPTGKTEADVVDALQMQDDNYASGTIKGRSGLVLDGNGITSSLTNTVQFGANGNAINITAGAGENKALRFTPVAGKTYAFVYTKTAATPANDIVKYQAYNWSNFATGQTKYRYDYKAATKSHTIVDDNGTPTDDTDDTSTDYFDAQKGVKYFLRTGDAAPYTYTMQDPFIGQGVGNLYLDAAGNTIASGYAVTGTTYYYTTDKGMHYTAAHNVTFAADMLNGLYEEDTTNPGSYIATTDTGLPTNGKAYYYKDGSNYIYCVFLPQQTTGWYELDTTKYVEATETAEVVGQTYFDKYTKNDGEYYAKIIKIQ